MVPSSLWTVARGRPTTENSGPIQRAALRVSVDQQHVLAIAGQRSRQIYG